MPVSNSQPQLADPVQKGASADVLDREAEALFLQTQQLATLQQQVDKRALLLVAATTHIRERLSTLVKTVGQLADTGNADIVSESVIERLSMALHLPGLDRDMRTAKAFKRIISDNPAWQAASVRGYRGISRKPADPVRAVQPQKGAVRPPPRKTTFAYYYKGPLDGPDCIAKRIRGWANSGEKKKYREIAGLIDFAFCHPGLQPGLKNLDVTFIMRGLLREAKQQPRYYRSIAAYAIIIGPKGLLAANIEKTQLVKCAEQLSNRNSQLLLPLVNAVSTNSMFRQAVADGVQKARLDNKRRKIAGKLETKPNIVAIERIRHELADESKAAQAAILLTKDILLPLAAWAGQERVGGPASRLLEKVRCLKGAKRAMRKYSVPAPAQLRLVVSRSNTLGGQTKKLVA